MNNNQPVVGSYGWKDSLEVCSQEYIGPALVAVLRRLGAQRILDLGCGNGALTRMLANYGFDVMGCDADEKGIELSRSSGGKFSVVSVYDDPAKLGEKDFDAVVSAEVIEHLFSPNKLPGFAASVLKPNGYLVITTPYHGYLKNLVLAILNKWDSHADPLWEGGHIKFFTLKSLSILLDREGFEVLEFKGLGRFPFLWKSMMLVARLR